MNEQYLDLLSSAYLWIWIKIPNNIFYILFSKQEDYVFSCIFQETMVIYSINFNLNYLLFEYLLLFFSPKMTGGQNLKLE